MKLLVSGVSKALAYFQQIGRSRGWFIMEKSASGESLAVLIEVLAKQGMKAGPTILLFPGNQPFALPSFYLHTDHIPSIAIRLSRIGSKA